MTEDKVHSGIGCVRWRVDGVRCRIRGRPDASATVKEGAVKKLKAAIGNSPIWGVAWAAGSVGLAAVLKLLGMMTAPLTPEELFQISTWFGAVGIIAGSAFSAVLSIAFRGGDVLSVRSVFFLIGGAAVGVMLVPILPGPVWIAPVLGAATAGGTLAAAKSAARDELTGEVAPKTLPGEARTGLP